MVPTYEAGTIMKSLVVKRSILLAGRKTSVSLEDEFWTALKKIAGDRHVTLSELSVASMRSANTVISHRRSGCSCWNTIVARRQRSRATKCSTNNRRQPRLYFRKRDLRYLFLLRQCLAADGEAHAVIVAPLWRTRTPMKKSFICADIASA